MKEADGYTSYYDKIDLIQHLDDIDYGMLRRSIDRYAAYGEIPTEDDLPGDLVPFFCVWKQSIDAGKRKYAETCIKRTYNVAVERYQKNDPQKPDFWKWYASFEGYDSDLFKKQPWYDLAANEHKRIQMYSKTTISNTITAQSDQEINSNHGNNSKLAPTGAADAEKVNAIAAQLSEFGIGAYIEDNNLNVLGGIAKRYGLSVSCIDTFMRTRIPNDQRDQAFVLADFIVRNGGRLPLGS